MVDVMGAARGDYEMGTINFTCVFIEKFDKW